MSAERKTADGTPAAQAQPAQVRHVVLFRFVGRSGLLGVLVLLCILAAVISPSFLQTANLINVLRQMSLYGIVSIGMTFVILTAGIDLSVGSTVGIVAVVVTQIVNGTSLPPWVALGIGIVVGGLVGAVNGLGIGST
jgi:ribose transport system permease protein